MIKRAIVHGFGYLATLVIALNVLAWLGPGGAVGLGSAIAYITACAIASLFVWRRLWRYLEKNWQFHAGFFATGAIFFSLTISLVTYFWLDPSVLRFFSVLLAGIFATVFVRGSIQAKIRKLRIYPPTVLALAETPVEPHLEARHVLASGTTGSGKSQVVRRAARMARLRNQPALVLDINGELMSRLFRPGHDIIIAAHDARAQAWSPLAELNGEHDAARIAAAMIPLEGSAEAREWGHYARTYLEACLIACLRDRSEPANNRRLAQLVASATPDYLKRVVGTDHAVAGMLSPGAARMYASAQGIAAARIGMALRALDPAAGIDSLSIARHVLPEQLQHGGWIFCPVPAQVRDPAFAVASIVAGIVVDALLAMGEDPDRRYWLLVDEAGQYPAIAGLARALTLGRKYGLAAVLAVQSVAQLRREYGPDGATELPSGQAAQRVARAGIWIGYQGDSKQPPIRRVK